MKRWTTTSRNATNQKWKTNKSGMERETTKGSGSWRMNWRWLRWNLEKIVEMMGQLTLKKQMLNSEMSRSSYPQMSRYNFKENYNNQT